MGRRRGAFRDMCAPDLHWEDPFCVEPLRGPEELADHAAQLGRRSPTRRSTRPGRACTRGRFIAGPVKLGGTHLGEIEGVTPSGRYVLVHAVLYCELDPPGERLWRVRVFLDGYDAAVQVGMLPRRGSLGERALMVARALRAAALGVTLTGYAGEALLGAGPRLRGLELAVLRRRRRHELVEQLSGHVGDLVDRAVEGGLVGLRGASVEPLTLRHVLKRGGLDLVAGRWRVVVVERSDVAAHAFSLSAGRRAADSPRSRREPAAEPRDHRHVVGEPAALQRARGLDHLEPVHEDVVEHVPAGALEPRHQRARRFRSPPRIAGPPPDQRSSAAEQRSRSACAHSGRWA